MLLLLFITPEGSNIKYKHKTHSTHTHTHTHTQRYSTENKTKLEMWANAQRDGRPAEYRWRPLFNAAKFG